MDFIKCEAYMKMAYAMAELSPDEDTQVGAIMLSPEGRIISSSFNGFLRGAPDHELPCDRESKCSHGNDKYTYMQHAERNILYNCCYQGIQTKDTTIVCTLSPCVDCLRACFASGVKTIVFDKLYHKFKSTDFYKNLPDVHVEVDTVGDHTSLKMEKFNDYEFEKNYKKEMEKTRTILG